MSNHAIEQTPPLEVGTYLTTREQIDRLPVGAVIGPGAPNDRYTRVENGWLHTSGDLQPPNRYFALYGYNKIIQLPVTVGTRLYTREQITSLPVGAVIDIFDAPGGDPHVRIDRHRWRNSAGRFVGDEHFALDGWCSVAYLPGSESSEPTTTVVEGVKPTPKPPKRFGVLRFQSSEDRYSVYLDADGEEVWLAHGTMERLTEFAALDLASEWVSWTVAHPDQRYYFTGQKRFIEALRAKVIDPEEVDAVVFCADCVEPAMADVMQTPHEFGSPVCGGCIENYDLCSSCDESFRDLTCDLSDEDVCERCRDREWRWCDPCDGYYHQDLHSDHEHVDNCRETCESPQQTFSIRNDGADPLGNDVRITVRLPGGVISEEGLSEISVWLRHWAYREFGEMSDEDLKARSDYAALAHMLPSLGDKWQAKDGNYTKRLSRLAYKEFGLKVPPEVISNIGNIASMHSREVNFSVEVTRDLNLPRSEFVHEDSCWWTDYYESRCALKTNGGFALRSFAVDPGPYDPPLGRAWVMPLRKDDSDRLVATFETLQPDAFVVFNGYGDLSGYAPARVLAHLAGMTYRKVEFTCSPMYVNGDSAYLVAPEEIATNYTDGHLSLRVQQHSNLFENETLKEKVLSNA